MSDSTDEAPRHDPEIIHARSAELQKHGVPERRATAVALIEQGLLQREVAEVMGTNQPSVSIHLSHFETQIADARWLSQNVSRSE